MARYEAMFERLDNANQGAFVPFVMLGDPDAETSLAIIRQLIVSGADADSKRLYQQPEDINRFRRIHNEFQFGQYICRETRLPK